MLLNKSCENFKIMYPTYYHATGDNPWSGWEVEEHGDHVLQASVEVADEQQDEN